MDLRRRLIASVGLLLGCLLAVTAAIQLVSLRSDIEAEVDASAQLVNILLAAGNGAPGLDERLVHARLRHLSIRTAGQPAGVHAPHPLLARLGLAPAARPEQEIRVGGRVLYIAPNPHSEIGERLQDTVWIWNTLLFFFGTTLLVTWWCADCALAPVRELEASLHRLARGEPDPALPAFALREFGRVARAIEHLAGALAEARAAQRGLAHRLITVQEDERRSLARELHDDMGQTLAALNATAAYLARNAARLTGAVVAECAADLRRDLRSCSEHLRAMLRTLRPHGLHASGLAPTLRELVQGWQGRHTEIAFDLDLPDALPAIGDAMALAVYRVVQEAVTNVVRHSGARRCAIRLAIGADILLLEVADDGRGLPAGVRSHGGLLGMRERVAMVGGRLDTLQDASGGLRLRAVFPLPGAAVRLSAASPEAAAGVRP
jgi:two-component system, NarL family, sensor histidine kinase UhpB